MGRYSIKSLNIPLVPQDNRNKLTDEEKRKRELRSKKLIDRLKYYKPIMDKQFQE